jgi:hypothetical protein
MRRRRSRRTLRRRRRQWGHRRAPAVVVACASSRPSCAVGDPGCGRSPEPGSTPRERATNAANPPTSNQRASQAPREPARCRQAEACDPTVSAPGGHRLRVVGGSKRHRGRSSHARLAASPASTPTKATSIPIARRLPAVSSPAGFRTPTLLANRTRAPGPASETLNTCGR